MTLRFLAAATAMLTITACSSGGGGNTTTNTLPTVDEFEADVRSAVQDGFEVARLSPTAFNAMPNSGRATFNGTGFVYIDPIAARDDDDLAMIGDATMVARFGAGTMTGSITNLVGGTGANRETAEVFAVQGRINLGQRTSIIGDDFDDNRTNDPNDWYTDARGRLTMPAGTFDIDADIEGKFMGTRVNNPTTDITTKGILGTSINGFATRNGREMPAEVELFGTHTP